MDFKNFQMTLSEALRRRNFAYTMCAVLGISNLLLCGVISRHEEHWTLFPWPANGTPDLEVSSSDFSDTYLREMADRLTSRLLTMNPQTVDHRLQEFTYFTRHSGSLLKKLEGHASKIKNESISTVFYPKEFSIERKKQRIHVMGDFHTYFGSDKAPVVQSKVIILTYVRGTGGIFLLQDFDMSEETP
jgi:conjugal transfer pilus assembly protein TraE